MEKQHFTPGDPVLIENIVNYLKAKGIFDEFRHECLADVDTKSSCQNLSQRVDGYTTKFLSNETWNPDLNKNELRNKLRRQIDESGMLSVGTDHVAEQVINPKIGQLFLPRIIEVVYQYIKEETEKLNCKQEVTTESLSTEKISENFEVNSKTKTPVIDPIADILSFTYSKPKSTLTSVPQKSESAHKKTTDAALKTERKKDDVSLAAKNTDVASKLEKKEEENTLPVKATEITIKSEPKENPIQNKDLDQVEKAIDENVVKLEGTESFNDNTLITSKLQSDPKDIKLKKEIKSEESESDIQKKVQKDIPKLDKKKSEDLKLSEESTLLNDAAKPHNTISKSSHQSKIKTETEKSKILKAHNSHKSSSSDKGKSKSKESADKHSKSSSKIVKPSIKDQSSSVKSDSSKSSKKDKFDGDSLKSKSSDSQSNKLAEHSGKKSSSKSSSIKKDISTSKNKLSSDKHAKNKLYKKQNTKCESEQQPSSTPDKGNKNILSSSSYESSQGSDQEKSCLVAEDTTKKLKHYSKHKKESSDKSSDSKHSKDTHDLKRSKKDPSNSLSKKHKTEKPSISIQRKLKESKGLAHDSAKICSRSNSFGSTSSISDSSNFSKEALPSSSEDVSESSSKQRESKKKVNEKEPCSSLQNFPPPPPPPPPSSDLPVNETTTSSSPEDTTQSSQDSESGSGSDNDSDADSCSSNVQTSSQNSGIESDLFLYESSSSEFEGFSSPERGKERTSVSDSVSSVHTSDLSSFEDDISIEDLSGEELPLSPDLKAKRKLPLKKAQELLDEKVHDNSDIKQEVLNEEPVNEKTVIVEEKLPETSLPTFVSPLSEEMSPPPEPRRELRRERKLNPKYASNEYTSIFTSKRTSFITKQMNLSPQKQASEPKKGFVKNADEKESIQEKCLIGTTAVHSEPLLVNSKTFNCESETISSVDTESASHEKVSLNSHNLPKNSSSNRLTLNVKNSEMKANNISKNLNSKAVKRKLEETDKIANKRLCRRNSADSSSSRNGANENKPFNNEKMNKSVNSVLIAKKNIKSKANGDILNKIEHLRKSSHTKSSHTSD